MISWLLLPFESLFALIVLVRNYLYDRGFFKVVTFQTPVICIGNLSAGGTGKTPHVYWLVKELQKKQKKVAIVSRGYGGQFGGYATRVNANLENAAEIFGDEPVFYARNLQIPVVVSHDRASGVEMILQQPVDVVLCDDGFQHRRLGRDKDIVLIDTTDSCTALLPRGRYREPLSSLVRADFVVLTKTNLVSEEQKTKWIHRLAKHQFSVERGNLFLSEMHLSGAEVVQGVGALAPQNDIILASTIARPETFFQLAKDLGTVRKHFVFKDHYLWTQADVDRIEAEAVHLGVKNLVVTEKDAVKLESLIFRYLNVFVVPLKIEVKPSFPVEKLYK